MFLSNNHQSRQRQADSKEHLRSCEGRLSVQGMSDLAAPLLCVMRDEAEAFWCFACLMEKLEVRPSLHLTFCSACPISWTKYIWKCTCSLLYKVTIAVFLSPATF